MSNLLAEDYQTNEKRAESDDGTGAGTNCRRPDGFGIKGDGAQNAPLDKTIGDQGVHFGS